MKTRTLQRVRLWGLRGAVVSLLTLAWLSRAWEIGHAEEFVPQQIYAQAAPAVVFVVGYTDQMRMAGTGSIIRREGLVLTNAHVVVNKESGQPYDRLWVFLKPDRVTGNEKTDFARRVKATLVAFDRNLDLALLRLEAPPQPLPVLELGDPEPVQIGDRVAAIGHPEQGGLWSLTTGVISAEFDDFQKVPGKHVFQTETSLNRGNSGGPLLNAEGRQVGVNTSIARKAEDGLAITAISFSLKSSVAKEWLAKQGVQLAYAATVASKRTVPGGLTGIPPSALPSQGDTRREPQASGPRMTTTQPSPPAPARPQAPALPPPRPYDLDQLVRGLDRVEQEMNDLIGEMRENIRRRQ